MSKLYTIYNMVGLFVGPSPSSTGHFINSFGQITNNDNPDTNFNLVFPLNRVINVNYGFSDSRTDIKSLGSFGNISRPILIQPNISLSFSYYLMGLINEARLGFLFNTPSGITGQALYGNSMNICPISGFLDRDYQKSNDTAIGWPSSTREPKNIFVATNQKFEDLNDYSTGNYKSSNVDVFAFGDCYLNSYKSSASITEIPRVTVDFVCNNIESYNYASGKDIPSINPKNGLVRTGTIFNLPNNFETSNRNLPTVVLPCDLSISIKSIPSGNYLATLQGNTLSTVLDAYGEKITLNQDTDYSSLPINIEDIKLQSYSLDLTLNREPLYNIGYKFPLDRRINFPVFCNLDFSMIVGESSTGSLVNFINKDREWDIAIKLSYQPHQLYTGVAIIYRFLGAKFNNISFQDSIGQLRTANLSFTTEINPTLNTRGFFMSGLLGLTNGNTVQSILGTGIGNDSNPIEIIDFSELLLSNQLSVQPLY